MALRIVPLMLSYVDNVIEVILTFQAKSHLKRKY